MKFLKIILIVMVVCLLGTLSIGCSKSDSETTAGNQVATVQRGDLTIEITAVGNLTFSHQEDLVFKSDGRVEEVLVEVGDYVEEGQILYELDDTSIISLQKEVVQARINLRNAESAEKSAIAIAESAVADAKITLEDAQDALIDAGYSESEIAQAELNVLNARIALDAAQDDFERAYAKYVGNRSVPDLRNDSQQKEKELEIAEFNLTDAEETLSEMVSGDNIWEIAQKEKELEIAKINLDQAENTLNEQLGVELKQSELAIAQAALDEAIENLTSATMLAPFAGIVSAVNVEEDDTVKADEIIIELVDPDRFETQVPVNEMDIFNVQSGAQATIQVDSMLGIILPAEVTNISPVATIQSGVVNYLVKVEINSLQALVGDKQEAMQETMTGVPSEELPERVKQAIEAGLMTEEQAEEMMEQRQQGHMEQLEIPTMIHEGLQLKGGLTVTVSIILNERNDVLLVPNSAIFYSNGQTFVKVTSSADTQEDRPVTIGISNWQYTEIVEGLSEGEEVVVPQGTTLTESATSQERPGGMRLPGMGGIPH
ncbi:HlyD family efflux transporter periplasmic adaptor subunit [Chloroflexota bacterium]